MAQTDFVLGELFSYVNNNQKYYSKLIKAIDNEQWEYAAVLTWKTIILFMYEKLFQIKRLGITLPEPIVRQLEHHNITVYSCFDFCCLDDESLHTNLSRIWTNVEGNYKSTFKHLLDERNGLSHVNRYEDDYDKQWFKTYFEKALKLLKYFQERHHNQFSSNIYTFIQSNQNLQYFSECDINSLLAISSFNKDIVLNYILDNEVEFEYSADIIERLKEYIITQFIRSSSFRSAEENGKRLLKITSPFISNMELVEILNGIFEQQGTPNQIISAGLMPEILAELFEKTLSLGNLEDVWKSFIRKIDASQIGRYSILKDKIEEAFKVNSE